MGVKIDADFISLTKEIPILDLDKEEIGELRSAVFLQI